MRDRTLKLLLITTTSNTSTSNTTTSTTTTGPSYLSAQEMLGVGKWGSSMLAPEEDSGIGAGRRGVWLKSSQAEWT